MNFYFLIIITFAYFANGYIVVPGKCPVVPIVQNVENVQDKMLRGWYVIKYFANEYDNDSRCLYNKIEHFDKEYHQSIYYGIHNKDNETFHIPLIGYRKPDFPSGAIYNFNVTYKNLSLNVDTQILLLEDDYALPWICVQNGTNTMRYTWIESRYKALPEESFEKIKHFFKKYDLGWSQLKDVDHENCVYDV